jgi:hypothetical protein
MFVEIKIDRVFVEYMLNFNIFRLAVGELEFMVEN